MPITIGSQTDVPSTGDPIVSPWYQDTSRKIVHVFASNAARDAWTTPPGGAMAFVLATNLLYSRQGAAWVQVAMQADVLTQVGQRVAKAGDTLTGAAPLYMIRDPATGHGIELRTDGGIRASVTQAGGANINTPNLMFGRGAGASGVGAIFASFRVDSTTNLTPMTNQIGSITQTSATQVAFNTTSDPRLKEITGDVADAATLARALGDAAFRGRWLDPATGEAEAGGQEWVLLSSHDVEDVAAYAVTGARDAVDDDGVMVPQQVNYPALVPLLFAALAQALARIEALEGGTVYTPEEPETPETPDPDTPDE